MQNIILFLVFIMANVVSAQELQTHKLLPPEAKEHSDLGVLEDELQDKRLVMLGEMTHMYGNIFEMKARIIEYLHKELGFSTIAMESSMYDLWRMNSRNPEFSPTEFNTNVFGVWSSTEEFQRLVDYIAANDLKVIGFDSQVMNTEVFIEDFIAYCEEQDIRLKLNEDDLAIAIEEVLDEVSFGEDDLKFSEFEKELKRIISLIEKKEASEKNFHWLQFTKSLLAGSRDAYYNKEQIHSPYFANKQHNFRDAQMADNLLSYMSRNPEEKIVAWADNIHTLKDISSIKLPIISEFTSMGTWIKKALGAEVYSLASIHANDSLLEKNTWHQTPILENSFEHKLKMLEEPYLFVSSDQEAMKEVQQHRLVHYVDFTEGRLSELYDGYIFLEHAQLPKGKELRPQEEQNTTDEILKSIVTEKDTSFKSKFRILDKETKAPVPFANIVLKEAEIYRISNEEGYYDLQLPEALWNTSIMISSMGYEPRELTFEELSEDIYLKPSFEQLDAILISARGTTPRKVLKKAIKKIEEHYPLEPFNYRRYAHLNVNVNDTTTQDLELITSEYNRGYRQSHPAYTRLEQIRYNKRSVRPKIRLGFRGEAVQFSNVLHKRKYKKFDLEFVESSAPEDEGLYIIEFKTNRKRFGFTERWYPTTFSGLLFINKSDFAVVKVIQNRETTILEEDVKKYKYWLGEFRDRLILKEEEVIIYTKREDQKYYASEFFERSYVERKNLVGHFENSVFEGKSFFFDIDTENPEEITYDEWRLEWGKNEALKRVNYDEVFWSNFNPEDLVNSGKL